MKRSSYTRNPSYLPSGANYSPEPLKGMSYEDMDFLKSYLNGHHDNNYLRCPGCPSSSGTDTVIRHQVASTTLKADAAAVGIVVTGLLEAPLICFDGNVVGVIPYTNSVGAPGTFANYAADFLKDHGVGRYRCVSLSVKIEDETPELYRQGSILAVRNPSAIDLVPIQQSNDALIPNVRTYLRVLEEIPMTESDITRISANNYIGKSSEGMYAVLPYLDPLCPFIDRDHPDNKAVYSIGANRGNINANILNQANVLALKFGGAPDLEMPTLPTTPSLVHDLNTDGLIPCSKENMQTLMVLATGVDPIHTVYRISVFANWEYVTSIGSDWGDLMKPPMPTNLKLLQVASEVFRGMPAAYPASANSWNEIWDRFKGVYNSYVEPLATKVIQNLPPNMAPAAAGIKALLDTVTDAKKEIKQEVQQIKESVKSVARKPGPSGRR